MSLLTASELITFARQVAPQLGSQCRALPDDRQDGAVRIVDDEGRALILYQEEAKPERLFLTARLPEAAEAAGFAVRPLTVAASSAAVHVAAHIRRRLLPSLAQVLAEYKTRPAPPAGRQPAPADDITEPLTPLTRDAAEVLNALALPYTPDTCDGWVIGEVVSRHRSLPAAWWQTVAREGDTDRAGSRGMVPFLADALRRAGLQTAEPLHGRWVYFAPPQPGPALPRSRYAVEISSERSGSWDLVDRYTGAAIRSSGDQERIGFFAEQLENEHDALRELRVASLDLPGIQVGAAESPVLRMVAVILAREGFVPYGLDGVEHADVPGFLTVACPSRPGHVKVYRVLEPWGSGRPSPGQGAVGGGQRFDRDLAAYARCLTRPGIRAAVDGDHVQVEFIAAPTLLGAPGGASGGDKSALRMPMWLRPIGWDQ